MSAQAMALRGYGAARPAGAPVASLRHVVLLGAGKGGVGTSLVATLLAAGSALHGARTLLVDASDASGAGTISMLLGAITPKALDLLRAGAGDAAACVVPVAAGLSLLSATGARDAGVQAGERRALLRRVADVYTGYDLVLVDAGSRPEALLAHADAGVGRLLLVTEPDAIAAAATHAALKTVSQRHPALEADALVNRSDEGPADSVADHLMAGADRFLGRPIGIVGQVPADHTLRRALASGMHLLDVIAGSPAAEAAREIAAGLVSAARK